MKQWLAAVLVMSCGVEAPESVSVARQTLLPADETSVTAGSLWLAAGSSRVIGALRLTLQLDGNLVLSSLTGEVLWSSGSAGRTCTASTCAAMFQTDGNLVLYQGSVAYWASHTLVAGARLSTSVVQPYLSIRANDGSVRFASSDSVRLEPGEVKLTSGTWLVTPALFFAYQTDGNLVLYTRSFGVVWAAHAGAECAAYPCEAVFQTDGNLVLYENGVPYWASNTNASGLRLSTSAGVQLDAPRARTVTFRNQLVPVVGAPSPGVVNGAYSKLLEADGVLVTGQSAAPDSALYAAREVAVQMTAGRPSLRQTLRSLGVVVAVAGEYQVSSDIPEHADLATAFPAGGCVDAPGAPASWDACRGLGPTMARKAQSAFEENLLCYPEQFPTGHLRDRYRGESIMVHEFGHTIVLALSQSNPSLHARIAATYNAARAAGLWANTYAATNADEYFAELSQSWFDANATPNSVHNHVRTRDQLKAYDPAGASLMNDVYGDGSWRYSCPSGSDVKPMVDLAAVVTPGSVSAVQTWYGSSSWTVSGSAVGGRAPYRYQWSASAGSFSNLSSRVTTFSSPEGPPRLTRTGTFTLTVTDSRGIQTARTATWRVSGGPGGGYEP